VIEIFAGHVICGGIKSGSTVFIQLLVQPAFVEMVTEYVPGIVIVMQFMVAPVFHR
jgi:hypothetical protein